MHRAGVTVLAALAGPLILLCPQGARCAPAGLERVQAMIDSGDLGPAEKAVRALLIETEASAGPDALDVALVLDELAVVLRRCGKERTREAELVCERAMAIKAARVGTDDASYAASEHNLGLLYYARTEYERAGPLLTHAHAIRVARLGEMHPDVARSLMSLGSLESQLGRDSLAVPLMERALAIQRARPDTKEQDRILTLNALAAVRYGTGEFPEAVSLFEEALSLLKRGGDRNVPLLGTCHHNLGTVYLEMNDLISARANLERARTLRQKVYGRDHPLVAFTRLALGDALERDGDLSGAEVHYTRAVEIQQRAYGSDNPEVGWAKTKLGLLYLTQGDRSRAGPLLREALAAQEALGKENPDLWVSLLGLARIATETGDSASAEGYYRRTEDILERAYGPMYPDLGTSLAQHALSLSTYGDSGSAMDHALRAATIQGEHLRRTSHGFAERQSLAYTSRLSGGLDLALALLTKMGARGRQQSTERVWDALIRSRALVLDEIAQRNRHAGSSDSLGTEWQELRRSRRLLANLIVRGSGSENAERHRESVARAMAAAEQSERSLARASTRFRSALRLEHAGFAEVATALPPGSAMVSFALHGAGTSRSYVAFVLDSNRKVTVVSLGTAEDIDRSIVRWRHLATRPPQDRRAAEEEASCRAAGRELRIRVWDPIVPHLRGARVAFLVPDGDLHGVPFAALPLERGGYLVESSPVLHCLSAERDLVEGAWDDRVGEGLLAVGGVDFESGLEPEGTASSSRQGRPGRPTTRSALRDAGTNCTGFASILFPPLPESGNEVTEVASLWPRSEEVVLLSGSRATEETVKRSSAGKRVLHLATHAFILSERCLDAARSPGVRGIGGTVPTRRTRGVEHGTRNPLQLSGLVLAGANRRGSAPSGAEDGILTSEEIAAMDLSGVEWAVLSACDTGSGDVLPREGVLGLGRAFRAARVGTLIVSLWPVEDASARTWMKHLYRARYRENLPTSEAVREAHLRVLRDRRARGWSTHPFHWASFVASGNWN